eukprot:1159118-Pelagomonas_calceolata.AAC.9
MRFSGFQDGSHHNPAITNFFRHCFTSPFAGLWHHVAQKSAQASACPRPEIAEQGNQPPICPDTQKLQSEHCFAGMLLLLIKAGRYAIPYNVGSSRALLLAWCQSCCTIRTDLSTVCIYVWPFVRLGLAHRWAQAALACWCGAKATAPRGGEGCARVHGPQPGCGERVLRDAGGACVRACRLMLACSFHRPKIQRIQPVMTPYE